MIEMAGAAGITLVPDEKRNPLYTTTIGVGEVSRDAIKKAAGDSLSALVEVQPMTVEQGCCRHLDTDSSI